MKSALSLSFVVAAAALRAATADAAVVGPYAADANTLHLWHFDGSAADAAPGGLNLVAGNGATLDNPAARPAFGTAAGGFTAGATGGYVGAGAPANTTAGGTDNVNIALQDPASRAFTLEALVKLNATQGTHAFHVISGEGEGATNTGDRAFQFRILPTGFSAGTSDNTRVRVELNNFGGNQVIRNLPDAGPNAVNTADWFHVAVTYNGQPGSADNLAFYWTRLDDAATAATLLETATQSGNLPMDNNGATGGLTNTDFAIGNELRSTGGQGEPFLGLIDEVRISNAARAADQFVFAVPEPFALPLLAPLAVLLVRRRR